MVDLTAIPTSPMSIMVTWDIPFFPNGPINSYIIYFVESDTVQQSQNNEGFTNRTIESTQLQYELSGLVAFTYYTIRVQAIGEGGSGDIEEVLQRTNSTTPETPTEDPTQNPTEESGQNMIFYNPPPPSQINTGLLM